MSELPSIRGLSFLTENAPARLTSIPVGSVVSVDTVIDDGKLFAARGANWLHPVRLS